MAELRLHQVVKRFGHAEVIHGIDLEIEHGHFVVFVGPSGCGKSTLLRMIAGLEEVTDGEIFIDGELVNEIDAAKRGLAMVFQSYALYPHMTVRKNLSFGLETMRAPKALIEERVAEAARILQIEPLLDRRPAQLSGGQRQRVAIGRAIVREPRIFLFDEPLSNLDAELRVQMRVELAKLHQRIEATMIYVTHDQVEAMTMADTIVVLRMGRIEQVGTPLQLYNEPANIFVAGFIGSPRMNFLEAQVVGRRGEGVEVRLGDGTPLVLPRDHGDAKDGEHLTLGVRPEHLVIGESHDERAAIKLTVNLTEPLGGESFVYGTLQSGEPVTIKQPGQVFIRAGATIAARIEPELCHLFDRDGQALAPPPHAASSSGHDMPSGLALYRDEAVVPGSADRAEPRNLTPPPRPRTR
jgi:ABC-type sugar transport system ATPase subunit